MYLRYQFSNLGKSSIKTKEEAIKSTDEAAKAMGDLIKTVGGVVGGSKLMMKIMARAYTRKVTDDYIEYHFYLLDWLTKLGKRVTKP
jgi:hypothetical protein